MKFAIISHNKPKVQLKLLAWIQTDREKTVFFNKFVLYVLSCLMLFNSLLATGAFLAGNVTMVTQQLISRKLSKLWNL